MNKLKLLGVAAFSFFSVNLIFAQTLKQPNVLVILTDDQGYGDLGINGNIHVKTPVLDRFAKESVRFTNFYVSPVCAPTRSSLLTGRYSLRTGIRDTYEGGAIMASSEITLAEILKQAKYTTGIFGKWHLGDSYPSRPQDQGFDETLIHLAGGMGQPGDFTNYFKKDSSYFNPVLWHNGTREFYPGYCSDIFAAKAIEFIEKNRGNPFFCYLTFNAPHAPLQVPDKYYLKYKNIDPSAGYSGDPRPFSTMTEKEKEMARRVYAMVDNIDENIGLILQKLDDLKLAENTIVIFMTDNGPQQTRYNAGMHGLKATVYRGGIRVPFYLRYPSRFTGDKDVELNAAHIDLLPTLAHLCNAKVPKDRKIDGKDLVPAMDGQQVDWKNRSLFFYWTRRYPELYNNIALQIGSDKLVGNTDYNANTDQFELFDVNKDPYELDNRVNKDPVLAQRIRDELEKQTKELVNSENLLHQPRIVIGSKFENPTYLNRNDATGRPASNSQEDQYGFWKVSLREGTYNIRFKFSQPLKANGKLYLETGTFIHQKANQLINADVIEMKNVKFLSMDCDFIPFYSIGSQRIFPFWVELSKN